jgi:pteridine reductase
MNNKVAFITGSAKRLGAHTAEHLHQLGYNIVIHCLNSVTQAHQLMDKLNQKRPDSAALVKGDLCELTELPRLVKEAYDCFGRLDILINNASAFYPTPIGSITTQDWHSLVGSNMQAPLFLSQYCQPHLQQQNGVIINMVDIHAEKPLKEHTLYCVAKAALVAMTKSLAQELAPFIRVNGVAPGAILWPEADLDGTAKQDILQQVPMGRIGTPQDIAEAIEYLITAPYVTGQIIAVDGGRSITSASKA